jgi:hypothetical protein
LLFFWFFVFVVVDNTTLFMEILKFWLFLTIFSRLEKVGYFSYKKKKKKKKVKQKED